MTKPQRLLKVTQRETGSAKVSFIIGLIFLLIIISFIISMTGQLITLIKLIPAYLTSPIQTMMDTSKHHWDGILQGWQWATAPMLLAGKFFCVAAGVSAATIIATVGWSFVSRRKKPRVFISYHHSKFNVVSELTSAIGDNICLEYIPFTTAPEHNQLLDDIHAGINQCDLVLCIPGAEPSFVQHEVFAAVQSKKPLIFLVEYNAGKLPNTAQKSYPVFNLRRVQLRNYESVKTLILYLYGDWRSTLKLYLLPHEPVPFVSIFIKATTLPVLIALFPIFALLALGLSVAIVIEGFLSFETRGMVLGVFTAAFLCVLCLFFVMGLTFLLGNYVSGLIWHRISNEIISRRVKTGSFAYASLQPVFNPNNPIMDFGPEGEMATKEGRWLLASLWRIPPAAYYQNTGTGDSGSG
ncbi:hypothetical protein D3C76_648320 [compost metagenome]